jgi:GWxTD domain-containing protein
MVANGSPGEARERASISTRTSTNERLRRGSGQPTIRIVNLHYSMKRSEALSTNRSTRLLLLSLFCLVSITYGIRTVTSASPSAGNQDREKSKNRDAEATNALPERDRFWLTEDVAEIISREERSIFVHLVTAEERDQFAEQFWARRATDPTALTSSVKQEHYERIVIANEKYGTKSPGWTTDRGRIYIRLGPPDSVVSRRPGESADGPPADGDETQKCSREIWHYRHIEGLGENVELEFVDLRGSGDYQLVTSPGIKDELIFVPTDTLGTRDRENINPTSPLAPVLYAGPAAVPVVKFKDLEAMAVTHIIREQIHFSYQTEFAKATHATTVARILMYMPGGRPAAVNTQNGSSAGFEIFGRISRTSGWVVETFERKIVFDNGRGSLKTAPDCQFNVPIAPGTYRLALVAKNLTNGEMGTLYEPIDVPPYEKISVMR